MREIRKTEVNCVMCFCKPTDKVIKKAYKLHVSQQLHTRNLLVQITVILRDEALMPL